MAAPYLPKSIAVGLVQSIFQSLCHTRWGLGTQIVSKTNQSPRVIVGHDYRSYSEEVKKKLIEGLIDTGCNIEDIGLALSPTAYSDIEKKDLPLPAAKPIAKAKSKYIDIEIRAICQANI